VFLDWKGIVQHKFVPRGQMLSIQLYQDVLARLKDAVCRKSPELWENQTWMLRHDNAPVHASLLIRSYLTKHETYVVPHPPYSPDLAPADFYLFPKLKTNLNGRRFQTIEEIQENVTNPTNSLFTCSVQCWLARHFKRSIFFFLNTPCISGFECALMLKYAVGRIFNFPRVFE
jgi:histone-lysine N-methyltransferase SETMAR